jgi:hypothetical protein
MAQDICNECGDPAQYWTTAGAWCPAHAGPFAVDDPEEAEQERLRDEELERLDARRECRYGGCNCCALLVEARDEVARLTEERERDRALLAECREALEILMPDERDPLIQRIEAALGEGPMACEGCGKPMPERGPAEACLCADCYRGGYRFNRPAEQQPASGEGLASGYVQAGE